MTQLGKRIKQTPYTYTHVTGSMTQMDFFSPSVPTGRHTRSAFFFINQCAHGCQQHSLCTRALKVKSYINTAGDMDVSIHTSTFCCNNRKCIGTRENQRLIRLLGAVCLNVGQQGEGIYAAVFRYPN